jgi:hypothetical protein
MGNLGWLNDSRQHINHWFNHQKQGDKHTLMTR